MPVSIFVSTVPAFGMAEVAIGGTCPDPMAGLRVDVVDARLLEQEGVAVAVAADGSTEQVETRELVKLGGAPEWRAGFDLCENKQGVKVLLYADQ